MTLPAPDRASARKGMLRHAAWIARALGRGEQAPFSQEDLAEIAASIGVRRVTAGTPLLAQGKPVRSIAVIQEGSVGLYHRAGLRRVTIQILGEGDVLGDLPYFCQIDAPFTGRSISDVTLLELHEDVLERLLATRPALSRRFLFSLASRLERMQRRLLELTQRDLRGQIARLLLDETEGRPGVIPLPQSTFAELLGAARPSVNQVLKALEGEGLVRLAYRRVEVLDPEGMQRLLG
jgi:CRP-like cAMP-binding protein